MRHVGVIPFVCLLALGFGSRSAMAGKLEMENDSSKDRVLESATARNSDSSKTETQEPGETVAAGKSTVIDFTTIDKPKLKKTEWSNADKRLNASSTFRSIQEFQDLGDEHSLTYTLMFSDTTDISYFMSDADLAVITPVAEGVSITTDVNGIDQTGHFPSSVIFVDAQTDQPYQGPLTSEGQINVRYLLPGDLTGDCIVNIEDLFALLGLWGPCLPGSCPPACPGDLTGDCMVDINDVFVMLGAWGPCS